MNIFYLCMSQNGFFSLSLRFLTRSVHVRLPLIALCSEHKPQMSYGWFILNVLWNVDGSGLAFLLPEWHHAFLLVAHTSLKRSKEIF